MAPLSNSGLYFFRDNNDLEADLIIEGGKNLALVEIKALRTFSPEFRRVFSHLQKIDKAFGTGVAINAGDQEMEFIRSADRQRCSGFFLGRGLCVSAWFCTTAFQIFISRTFETAE